MSWAGVRLVSDFLLAESAKDVDDQNQEPEWDDMRQEERTGNDAFG